MFLVTALLGVGLALSRALPAPDADAKLSRDPNVFKLLNIIGITPPIMEQRMHEMIGKLVATFGQNNLACSKDALAPTCTSSGEQRGNMLIRLVWWGVERSIQPKTELF